MIPATDAATGAAFEARVDLAWQGVGPVQRGSGSAAPPQANAPRVRTRYREATLSGTVTDGTIVYAPDSTAVASMTTAVSRPKGADSRAIAAGPSVLGIGGTTSGGPVGSARTGSLVASTCPESDSNGERD